MMMKMLLMVNAAGRANGGVPAVESGVGLSAFAAR